MDLAPGTKLGPYEVQSLIGAGGMGEVCRARGTRLQRDVAIKVLPTWLARYEDRLRRFEQEAKSMLHVTNQRLELMVFTPDHPEGRDFTWIDWAYAPRFSARGLGVMASRDEKSYACTCDPAISKEYLVQGIR